MDDVEVVATSCAEGSCESAVMLSKIIESNNQFPGK